MNTKPATNTIPGANPYPLLSRPIQRTYANLRRTKHDMKHGSVNPDDHEASRNGRRYAIGLPHGQVSMRTFTDDREHHSFDWAPVTFVSSGSTPMPFKTPVTGSSEGTSRPWSTQPFPRLDVPGTTPSGSLQLAKATLDETPTDSSDVNQPPSSTSTFPSPHTHELKLNPFRSPLHSTIMFPSLGTVLNDLLDDRASTEIEIDALGCALLPASEFILALESECSFYYEFWDGHNEAQYCFPVDIALYLDPARAPLYDYYALALPSVPKIAVRLASLALPTRFTRLLPKPRPPVSQDDSNDSGASYAYTTSYRGRVLKPQGQQAAAEGEEDKPEVITPAKGIYLAPNWERVKPLSAPSVSSLSSRRSSSEEGKDKENQQDPTETGTETENTRRAAADKGNDRRGFTLRAWIPIPLSLFENKETCTFRIDARVWIEDPYTYVRSENGQTQMSRRRRYRSQRGGKLGIGDFSEPSNDAQSTGEGGTLRMVEASKVLTVSHLQSGREMV